MIYGIFHKGSGLGNQLHRYVAIRILAEEKGYQWGMVAPDLFKGMFFADLDLGLKTSIPYHIEQPSGKAVADVGLSLWEEWNKNVYDPDINFVEDNTIIDGNFEDSKYFEHRLPDIREWLKVEPLDTPDNVCIINFRGGEYKYVSELFLPVNYWYDAMVKMQAVNIKMIFEVHTDDKQGAMDFFNQFEFGKLISGYTQDIDANWRSIRYAKYLILANSSFAVLPALLNEDVKKIIAPRYWNRYNTKQWEYPQNYYKKFTYI